jgi:hypothetical protein
MGSTVSSAPFPQAAVLVDFEDFARRTGISNLTQLSVMRSWQS